MEHLDKEIASALKPTGDPGLAAQISSHRAQRDGAPSGLSKLIEAGDTATTSAVLNAPAYLSGLGEKDHAILRELAARRFAPEKVAQRAEATDALARVEGATEHFMDTIAGRLRDWRGEDARIIQEGLQ